MMSDVNAVTGTGDGSSTGGEGGAELTNTEVTSTTGADQGGQGGTEGNSGAGEGAGAGEGGLGEGGAEGSGAAAPKPEDDVNKRFSKITRERDEATRREREANENLRRALEALERANGGKKPEPKPEPKPEDDLGPEPEPPVFEDPEQYQRDMAIYTQKVTDRAVKLQLRTERANQEREAAESRNRQAVEEHGRAWMARRNKAIEEMPDYVDVAENPNLPITLDMALAMQASDHGAKVAYYLGQHPAEAERIAKLPPRMQLMELGKLEVQVSAPKAPPKTSKAPPPVKPLTGTGEPQTKSPDEMSMEEYAAYRKAKH